ncbi:Bifunctional SulP family inorganic anion transporter/carbonic anhydrase OS=Streptomyces microflavus OX=1919 GN=G3I39_26565 PE=3 SV=1 [Streptomyces microflavus]
MSACAPTRHDRTPRRSRPRRASGMKSPHSPPPTGGGRRLRIAGADVSASITVFLIAVPMSLGLALAVGAPLEAGLVAAAIGGIVAGLLGAHRSRSAGLPPG